MSAGSIAHSNVARRPRVVVVGTGHGGMEAVHALRDEEVDVLLVDRNNYHKFQPLLYQVATAGLAPADVTQSARHIFHGQSNFDFRMTRVESVDFDRRELTVATGPPITYDYLIVAAGASTAFFGVEGAEEHAFPLKNLSDAINLRSHILERFEAADTEPEVVEDGALNFIIVGGGPTGVETAGALRELFDRVLSRDFPSLEMRNAKVSLIEMGPSLLPAYKTELQTYTARVLERRGVDVRLNTTVRSVSPERVELDGGEVLKCHTLIWAAGIRANPLADVLGVEQTRGGRVVVNEFLQVEGRNDVYVVGDMAGATDPSGELYPQLAPVAIQQGKHAAVSIMRTIKGSNPEPFEYRDRGMMATIGRNAAVVQFKSGRVLRGRIAWSTWVLVHVLNLVGFRNKASVLLNWLYNYFTWDRGPRQVLASFPERDALDAPQARTLLATSPKPGPIFGRASGDDRDDHSVAADAGARS